MDPTAGHRWPEPTKVRHGDEQIWGLFCHPLFPSHDFHCGQLRRKIGLGNHDMSFNHVFGRPFREQFYVTWTVRVRNLFHPACGCFASTTYCRLCTRDRPCEIIETRVHSVKRGGATPPTRPCLEICFVIDDTPSFSSQQSATSTVAQGQVEKI